MIYLDNAATSWPKAPNLASACVASITEPMGNIGRSAHMAAIHASHTLYSFRKSVQSILSPTETECIICTSGATESLNVALFGTINPGDTVLTTPAEHNAVARPLEVLQQRGVRILTAVADCFGRVDIDEFEKIIKEKRPSVAVFAAANNVTGAINPVEAMLNTCCRYEIPFVIDAAQAVGETDLPKFPKQARGALCFSLHKGLLGMAGVGIMALYGSYRPRPLQYGGTGSNSDSTIQPEILPDVYESGTLPIQAIAANTAAIGYYIGEHEAISLHKQEMSNLLWDYLSCQEGLRMLSPKDNRVGIVSVTVEDGTIRELSQKLFAADIAVRSGFHCAPTTHHHIGTFRQGGAIRCSVGFMTTKAEIEQTAAHVAEALWQLR